MGGLRHICFPTFIVLSVFASNYVTGYGYGTSTRTTAAPTPPPPPPKYQNDREQWGGPSGDYTNGGGNSPDRRPPGSSQQWTDDQLEPNNFAKKRSHVERYGFPEDCVRQPDPQYVCSYYVEIAKEEDHPESLHFEVSGHIPPSGGYVGMGLSRDKLMGEDHIVECVLLADGSSRLYHSWAAARRQPTRLTDNHDVITTDDRYPQYDPANEVLTCKFRRPIITQVEVDGVRNKYDLEHGKYHVLLATGGLQFPKSDSVGYHGDRPLQSGNAYVSPGLLGYLNEKYPPRSETSSSGWHSGAGKSVQSLHVSLIIPALVILLLRM